MKYKGRVGEKARRHEEQLNKNQGFLLGFLLFFFLLSFLFMTSPLAMVHARELLGLRVDRSSTSHANMQLRIASQRCESPPPGNLGAKT